MDFEISDLPPPETVEGWIERGLLEAFRRDDVVRVSNVEVVRFELAATTSPSGLRPPHRQDEDPPGKRLLGASTTLERDQ